MFTECVPLSGHAYNASEQLFKSLQDHSPIYLNGGVAGIKIIKSQ